MCGGILSYFARYTGGGVFCPCQQKRVGGGGILSVGTLSGYQNLPMYVVNTESL